MREICLPVHLTEEDQLVEIEMKLVNQKKLIHYRLESFVWDVLTETDDIAEKLLKIYRLKKSISQYDPDWEVIQIYTPLEQAKKIQVLFRKK